MSPSTDAGDAGDAGFDRPNPTGPGRTLWNGALLGGGLLLVAFAGSAFGGTLTEEASLGVLFAFLTGGILIAAGLTGVVRVAVERARD